MSDESTLEIAGKTLAWFSGLTVLSNGIASLYRHHCLKDEDAFACWKILSHPKIAIRETFSNYFYTLWVAFLVTMAVSAIMVMIFPEYAGQGRMDENKKKPAKLPETPKLPPSPFDVPLQGYLTKPTSGVMKI